MTKMFSFTVLWQAVFLNKHDKYLNFKMALEVLSYNII
jgi:hypothetical protein